jgi:NTP pyrophosphatase (non-canonical NTP hydrolase)
VKLDPSMDSEFFYISKLSQEAHERSRKSGFHERMERAEVLSDKLCMGTLEYDCAQEETLKKALEHGGVDVPEKLMLIVSEVSEAMECYRKSPDLDAGAVTCDEARAGKKPEGMGSELADVVIRTIELAYALNIDIGKAIETKMAYNETRSYKHGGKRA